MGYQLWTSRATGYRRRGTRLAELLSVLGGGIVTRTISEPLQSAPADSPASEIKVILDARGFDIAGVQKSETGPVLGFVLKDELLSGFTRDHMKPMNAGNLISDNTPLKGLLAVLRRRESAFMLSGSSVCGIVTRADLNKPPIRVYLFGLISLLEMHLQFWVESAFGEDSWQHHIPPKRIQAARELQAERKRHDEAVTLLDCLQFCDKAGLLLDRPDLMTTLNLPSKKKAKVLFGRAERLRNDLAHSQLELAHGTSWEKQIELVESIEDLVHYSDEVVEQQARLQRPSHNGLWVASGN